MKRWICAFLALGIMCTAAGCRDTGLARPEFPLDEDAVTTALIEAGLPGIIAKSETRAETNGSTSYTLRDPADDNRTNILISSSRSRGKRYLQVVYRAPAVSQQPAFEWEDWKRQLIFAALLSGGFSDREALYSSFSAQKLPDEVYTEDEKRTAMVAESFAWDAELQGGYCIVSYRLNNARIINAFPHAKVLEYSPMLIISVYESKAYFEKIQKEAVENKNALRPSE